MKAICRRLVRWLFDIVDRMQSTFGRKFTRARWLWLLCRVMGLGSDSARVNEVAKLCRAVVRMTKGGRAPKVLLLASGEDPVLGF